MIGYFLATMVKILLSLRYRIRILGRKEILQKGKKGILLLPNHPALIAPIIMVSHFYRSFHPMILADKDQVDVPVIRSLSKMLNVIAMPDPSVYG